jgi:small Trp-rich protein
MWLVSIGLVLSLCKWLAIEPVVQWSWWVVFAPFLGAIIWWSYADATGYYTKKAAEQIEQKKKVRLQKQIEVLSREKSKKR